MLRALLQPASGQPAFVTILHRRILWRGSLLLALLACAWRGRAWRLAQEERPQITPGERKVPRKKEAGPRAVGVLQMAANGKTSLIPVAILVNGKFWDATAYKADPVPMALETARFMRPSAPAVRWDFSRSAARCTATAANLIESVDRHRQVGSQRKRHRE